MNQLAVVLIIVLLPGIIAATLANKLTVHEQWDSFKFGLYSFVLGVLTYSLLQVALYVRALLHWRWFAPLVWQHLAIWKLAQDGTAAVPPWEVVFAVFLALPTAFIVSACIQHKWITRLGNRLRVTSKYGDENLFSYFLNAKETEWVWVRDKAGDLTYEGKVIAYSENDNTHELVLYDVVVYRYSDSAELYSVPTVYLSKSVGEFVIETIPKDRIPEKKGHDSKAADRGFDERAHQAGGSDWCKADGRSAPAEADSSTQLP